MSGRERALRIVLRLVGAVSALAVVPIFVPRAWMDAAHSALGLGELPTGPVVGYLARSASVLYAMYGGLLLWLSTDVPRNRSAIAYMAWAMACAGVALFGIDLAEGLPAWWVLGEGPVVSAIGVAMIALLRGVPVEDSASRDG